MLSLDSLYNCKGPKRCTTTNIERNLTKADPTDPICNWSSCEEWCLSKGSSPCSKMYGLLRDVGASLKFEQCSLAASDGFVDHKCSTAEDLAKLNCKRSKYETTVILSKVCGLHNSMSL